MTYNIVKKQKALFLLNETAVDLVMISPENTLPKKDAILKYITVHLFLKGHLASTWKLRANVYNPDGSLMMRSIPVTNTDIERAGDFYCELRFDFPQEGNLLSCGRPHRVELEIYDGYSYDNDNYVSVMLAYFGDLNYLGSDAFIEPEWAVDLAPRISIFTDSINPEAQEKFLLVRMKCGRLLTPFMAETPYGGSHWMYTATIEKGMEITDFYFEALSLPVTTFRATETIVPDPLNYNTKQNFWYYDKNTGVFQFYSANQVDQGVFGIMEYALHFTNFRGRYLRSTPDTGAISDPEVYWDPRLDEGLETSFSQQNNLQGLLSISTSSIQLKNQDLALNNYFSEYDCFNNREVTIWKGIGSTISFLAKATIRSATLTDESADFGVDDIFTVLDNKYSDTGLKIFGDLSGFVLAEEFNRVIPRSRGKLTPWDAKYFWITSAVSFQKIDPTTGKMPYACCMPYNPALSTSVNRIWSLGYAASNVTLSTWPVSSHTSVSRFGGTASRLLMDMAAFAGSGVTDMRMIFAIGDSIKQGTQYGQIAEVTQDSLYIYPYNASLGTGDVTRSRVTLVIERGGILYYPLAIRDFTPSIGAFFDTKVTFVNNFEATVGLPSALDPASDKVYFRVWTDISTKASEVVKEFIETTNGLLNTPVSDFAPDQSTPWPDPELSFTIPFAGASEFPVLRDAIEKILKSSMSFIYLDSTGLVRYKSFLDGIYSNPENVSGVDPELELTEKNSAAFKVQFDLFDLYSGVSFDWTHNPYFYNDQVVVEPYGLQAVKALYKTNRTYEVETIVNAWDLSVTDFLEAFVKLVVGRSAIFELEVFEDHFGLFIGDDIRVARSKIIGGENSQMIRVISLYKSVNSHRVGLSDLKRFPTL